LRCLPQLHSLIHCQSIAGLRIDLIDEGTDLTAGSAGIARIHRVQRSVQLRIQARLQPLRERETVDQVDESAALLCCRVDRQRRSVRLVEIDGVGDSRNVPSKGVLPECPGSPGRRRDIRTTRTNICDPERVSRKRRWVTKRIPKASYLCNCLPQDSCSRFFCVFLKLEADVALLQPVSVFAVLTSTGQGC